MLVDEIHVFLLLEFVSLSVFVIRGIHLWRSHIKGLIYKLKQNGISGNLLDTITDFLNSRKQRVALNGQFCSWTSIEAEVRQGLILGPLLFLIYINDLSNDLITNVKLLADDTSLASVVHDVNTSANNLNNDLSKINDWETQWKMSFSPNPSK